MIVEFSVENFLSFQKESVLSLVPGKGHGLKSHIQMGIGRNDISILKSSLIFGANASGKSNFIKAIQFVKSTVLFGSQSNFPRSPFKLDTANLKKPSNFRIMFKLEERIFDYSFSVDDQVILKEKLVEVKKTIEDTIYERVTDQANKVKIEFPDFRFKNTEEEKRIQYIAKDTLPGKLFLSELNSRNISDIEGSQSFIYPYSFFKKNLVIITPNSKYRGLELRLKENNKLSTEFQDLLNYFNTGISGLKLQDYEFSIIRDSIHKDVLPFILQDLDNNQKLIVETSDNKRYAVFKEDGTIKACKLMTSHSSASKEEALFEIAEESDGTQRLFDLIPALLNLQNRNLVFVIDELDRSLHSILTRSFIEYFFKVSEDKPNQLITATHDTNLLDLDFFRKDEIWFVEKNKNGSSEIYSLDEFKPRTDKDIQKGYLLGRYGAIAVINKSKVWNK